VVNEAAIQAVLAQGVALAWFDRVGLAWDGPDAQRGGPVHEHWPEVPWSATAVWAWGMGYSITALEQALQAPKIGVIGHSRGGKAAMAAALWDSRIQARVSHNSGTGGVSRLQPAQPGAESLADLAERFPHWLSPLAQHPQHQALCEQNNWPADGLHALAPRGLCTLQADDPPVGQPDRQSGHVSTPATRPPSSPGAPPLVHPTRSACPHRGGPATRRLASDSSAGRA